MRQQQVQCLVDVKIRILTAILFLLPLATFFSAYVSNVSAANDPTPGFVGVVETRREETASAAAEDEQIVRPSLSHLQTFGEHLFWIDQAARAVYRTKRPVQNTIPPAAPPEMAEPQKLWSGLPLKSPVGMAVDRSGVVYLVDEEAVAVFSVVPGGPLKLLYSGAPLRRPSAIAAVAGRLYVVDAETEKLYGLDSSRKEITEEYDFEDEVPDRLVAAGKDLLAFSRQSRVLLRFVLDQDEHPAGEVSGPEWRQVTRADHTTLGRGVKIKLAKALGDVADLSFASGVVYFLDRRDSRLVLLSFDGGEPSSLPLSLLADQPAAIAAGEDAVYFAEGNPARIRRRSSLQPVTLNFVGEFTGRKIVALYLYLRNEDLLPVKSVDVARLSNLEELVGDLGLLPTRYTHDFQVLFCLLNPTICTTAQKDLPASPSSTPADYPVRLSAGQSVTLPDLPVITYTTRRNIKLPLDPSVYKPEFFKQVFEQPLGLVAAELAPKGFNAEKLKKAIERYNPHYLGPNILAETEGSFGVPLQAVKVQAVVSRIGLLQQNSFINLLADTKNVTGSATMFGLKQQSVNARRALGFVRPHSRPVPADPCLPVDPAVRSAALELVQHCQPLDFIEQPRVGIIDYDFNEKHPAFAIPNTGGMSALQVYRQPGSEIDSQSLTNVDAPERTNFKPIDHGTHIAAIIGARPQEGKMVGLLPQAKMYGLTLGNLDQALEELEFLRLYNVSLGEGGASGGPLTGSDRLKEVFIDNSHKLFIVAAGNEGRRVQKNTLASLGHFDNVLVVGASDVPALKPNTNERPQPTLLKLPGNKGSNYHRTWVGVVAPGENIKSALYNGQYGEQGGTSQAAAFVSAAAGALMAIEPLWAPWQVKFRLVATADLWTGTSMSNDVFAGVLNFKRAVFDTKTVVLQHQTNGFCRGEIEPESLGQSLVIKRGGDTKSIPLNTILRINRKARDSTEYTIIYYEERELDANPERNNHYLHREIGLTAGDIREGESFLFTPSTVTTGCTSGKVVITELLDFINKFRAPTSGQ